MTEREEEILKLIRENPLISQYELAYALGITRSGVAAHIHNLTKKGYISGRGYVLNEAKFITVIGGINMDVTGIAHNILYEQNSNPGTITHSLGGAGRNIALALTKLDIPNYLVSVYGDDLNGNKFIEDAKQNQLNLSCCEKISEKRTSNFILIDDVFGNKKIGIDDMDILKMMTPAFLNKYLDKINHSEYAIIDTNLPEESIHFLYQQVTVPIIIKTVSLNKNNRITHGIDNVFLLVTTPKELNEIIHSYKEPISEDIEQNMEYLLTKGVQNIIVFSPNTGLYFKNRETNYFLKKQPLIQINVNGASAALTSGVVSGLRNNLNWEAILEMGYQAALTSIESAEAINQNLSQAYLTEMQKRFNNT